MFRSDRTNSATGKYVEPSQNAIGKLPSWATTRSNSPAISLDPGIYEVTAQAQTENYTSNSRVAGGLELYGRGGEGWQARNGTKNNELNGATLIFDTRDLSQTPRVYAACYSTNADVRINMMIRKLL